MRRITALVVLALLLAGPAPAAAQSDDPAEAARELQDVEKELERDRARARELKEKAEALQAEVRAVQTEMVAVARDTQAHEAKLTRIEQRLAELESELAAKREAFAARRRDLRGTLAALQRVALVPPEALLVAPGEPIDVARSAMLLSDAVPNLESRANRLAADLEELRALRRQIAARRSDHAATAEDLAAERRRLETLFERKQALRSQTEAAYAAASERAAHLAAEAADLRELLGELRREREARREAARQAAREAAEEQAAEAESDGGSAAPDAQVALTKPGDIRPFPESRASLVMPAQGRLVARYGERGAAADGAGAAKGITLATRIGAQVVAPYDGQVAYAGPFRGYGRILIIEHGGGYHTLLAGLERIDAVVGQWVLAGEPVGLMSQARDRNPELYVELRRQGDPINPLPWLATTGNKVRG